MILSITLISKKTTGIGLWQTEENQKSLSSISAATKPKAYCNSLLHVIPITETVLVAQVLTQSWALLKGGKFR